MDSLKFPSPLELAATPRVTPASSRSSRLVVGNGRKGGFFLIARPEVKEAFQIPWVTTPVNKIVMNTILPDMEEGVTVQRLIKLIPVMEKVKLFLRSNSIDCSSLTLFIMINMTRALINMIRTTAIQKPKDNGFVKREKLKDFLGFVDKKKVFT